MQWPMDSYSSYYLVLLVTLRVLMMKFVVLSSKWFNTVWCLKVFWRLYTSLWNCSSSRIYERPSWIPSLRAFGFVAQRWKPNSVNSWFQPLLRLPSEYLLFPFLRTIGGWSADSSSHSSFIEGWEWTFPYDDLRDHLSYYSPSGHQWSHRREWSCILGIVFHRTF